jgi:hypothetical protein
MLIRGPPHKVSLFLDIRKVMFCLFKVWAFDVIWKKILGIFKWAGGPQVSHRSTLLPWAPVATLTACFPRAPGVAGRWPALTIAALPHVRHPPYPRRQFTREAKFSFSPSLLSPPRSTLLIFVCSPCRVPPPTWAAPARQAHQGAVLVCPALLSTGAFFRESSRRPPWSRHELDAVASSASSSSVDASYRWPPLAILRFHRHLHNLHPSAARLTDSTSGAIDRSSSLAPPFPTRRVAVAMEKVVQWVPLLLDPKMDPPHPKDALAPFTHRLSLPVSRMRPPTAAQPTCTVDFANFQ